MSGRRFGGTYSPGGSTEVPKTGPGRFRGRRAMRVDVRARLLYVLPLPLLFTAFGAIGGGDPMRTGLTLGAFASLMAGAWLLNEGQKAEAAYEARAVARRPSIPRKIMAAALAGIGVGLAQIAPPEGQVLTSVAFALLAAGAHLAAFGIDPLKNKGIDLGDAESGRVAEALETAEARLAEIVAFADDIRDREISRHLNELVTSVRAMLRQIEADPRDLTRARRYLSVYLVGAHEATRKYAEAHDKIRDPQLRGDYLELISDLEASFSRGRDKLLAEDRTDLEVEIEVLRDRLGQEVR